MEPRNESCQTVELSIGGMTCAACSARIERQLNKLPGVAAAVNLPAERAHIRFDPEQADVDKLIATIVKTGFTATPSTADTRDEEKARKEAAYRAEVKRFWIALASIAILSVALVTYNSLSADTDEERDE